jgi:hypothetical protein
MRIVTIDKHRNTNNVDRNIGLLDHRIFVAIECNHGNAALMSIIVLPAPTEVHESRESDFVDGVQTATIFSLCMADSNP